tara:strand:- start:642 stop:863 length:222 start_codon:yes stop_codon:yes gene_type:complete
MDKDPIPTSESEVKVLRNDINLIELIHGDQIGQLKRDNKELRDRLDRLECKWDALVRRLEGLERHPEDEGWFD